MIKGIGSRRVEITDDEFEYYKELVKRYDDDTRSGSVHFNNLFETDDNGIITMIKPEKEIPWLVLFFIQNLMINQRIREFGARVDKAIKKLGQ